MCYQVKTTASDEKLKDKLTEEDKKTVMDASSETEQWMNSNPNASLEELEAQKKQLEDKFNPVMAKLYGQGQPGGPDMGQGFPGGPGGPGFPGGPG